MPKITRRAFLEMAAAIGAAATCGFAVFSFASSVPWKERRVPFPEGVASGDPDFESVLLWTRYPQSGSKEKVELTVEVAERSRVQTRGGLETRSGMGGIGLDLPGAGGRLETVDGVLVPVHGCEWGGESRRKDDDGTGAG